MNIELLNGDCLVLLKKLEDNSIHCVITDPPYFLNGLNNEWNPDIIQKKVSKSGIIRGLPVGMKFDPKQGKDFQKFYSKISKEVFRVLKPGGFFLSFSQPRLVHRMGVAIEDEGFEIRDMYAWYYTKKAQMKAFKQDHFVYKMNISEERKQDIIIKLRGRKTPQLKPQFESIILSQKPKKGTSVNNWLEYETGLIDTNVLLNGNYPSTVMLVEKPTKDEYNYHLTVKPTKLIEHLISIFTLDNQTILDPFMGSGTTGVACKNLNRNFIGIELDAGYFEIAKKRINETTNQNTEELF